jgi:hypothetical protein
MQQPPAAPEPRRGEMLPSNVDAPFEPGQATATGRRTGVLLVAAITFVGLLLVLGGAFIVLGSPQRSGTGRPPAAAPETGGRATATLAPSVGVAVAPRGPASGGTPEVNGISCDSLESTLFHIHVHLAIFVQGQAQVVPYGIGIGEPWQVSDSPEGPFVEDGTCFYWIHTHTQDGIVHIEAPTRRRFTLGDFFAVWGLPLSSSQVGPAQGPVVTYVNGKRDDSDPATIVLLPHQRIQLDIGQDVPPVPFDFPPGT